MDRPRVLLIEDNLTVADLYALVLEDGFDVLKATRGEAGYSLACAERPDAIVIDIMLPDVDGLTIVDRLHADPATAGIPVIALTGETTALARAHQRHADLAAVLMKPCPAERLLATIDRALRPPKPA